MEAEFAKQVRGEVEKQKIEDAKLQLIGRRLLESRIYEKRRGTHRDLGQRATTRSGRRHEGAVGEGEALMKLMVELEVSDDLQNSNFAKGFAEEQTPVALVHEALCRAIYKNDQQAFSFLNWVVDNINVAQGEK